MLAACIPSRGDFDVVDYLTVAIAQATRSCAADHAQHAQLATKLEEAARTPASRRTVYAGVTEAGAR